MLAVVFDPASVKLGKKPPVRDSRNLQLAKYHYAYTAPLSAHWGHGIAFNMDGNDNAGDCVEAEGDHQNALWASRTNVPYAQSPANCIKAYSSLTGYSPSNPGSDKGTDMLSACKYWKSTGIGGQKIDAYMEANPQDAPQIEQGIYTFGGVDLGLALPMSAQSQTFNGPWTVTSGSDAQPGSWGGHCILLCGYTQELVWCVTWGALQAMTWDFLHTYADEAFVFLSRLWLRKSGNSPSGFAWAQLEADLAAL